MITAAEIHDKAIELGYCACGIIKAADMRGYGDMIGKRVERFPFTESYHNYFTKFASPDEAEPWVKSIIVCAGRYGKYAVPEGLQGRVAKYYLTDYRAVGESDEYKAASLFDAFLTENGVKFTKNTLLGGNSAGKYAAMVSGIGIIRKNNLLYTQFGSWVWHETWLIGHDMEYINSADLPPCPDGCEKCVGACGTGALAEPYQVNPFTCISSLTWGGLPNTLPKEELRPKMGGWLYGCDECQDCCPMNEGCWTYDTEFPGLDGLQEVIDLEHLCALGDEALAKKLSRKFFYINPGNIWKWKTNALRAMANEYKPEYLPYIKQAQNDGNALIKEMANWAFTHIGEVDDS